MPNESGFVDFNQYFDQNQSEEQRLMSEAMDRARGSDAAAQSALTKSQREAAGHLGPDGRTTYNPDGTIAGDTGDISQTASYGAYLDAKKKAVDAYSGIGDPSANPFSEAVRGALRAKTGMGTQATDALSGMMSREGNAAIGVAGHYSAQQNKEGADATYRTDQAKAASDRKAADDAAKAAQTAATRDRITQLWAGRDQRGTASFASPFAGNAGDWTSDERAQLDELQKQSRQDGSWDAANAAGAWDTSPGSYGAGGNRDGRNNNAAPGTVGVTAGNGGTVKYGDPRQGFVTRKGGFKGWGP